MARKYKQYVYRDALYYSPITVAIDDCPWLSVPEKEEQPEESKYNIGLLEKIIAALPELDRLIFSLYYVEMVDTPQIGRIITDQKWVAGKTLNQSKVSARIRKTRRRIKAIYESYCQPYPFPVEIKHVYKLKPEIVARQTRLLYKFYNDPLNTKSWQVREAILSIGNKQQQDIFLNLWHCSYRRKITKDWRLHEIRKDWRLHEIRKDWRLHEIR